MSWEQITVPTEEPITLAEAKLQANQDLSVDDALITDMIITARKHAEKFRNQRFITQTIAEYFDNFPSGDVLELLFPPLQSVTHIKYTDSDGTETTWSSALYQVDTFTQPGRIAPVPGETWPSFTARSLNAVEVHAVVGYGDEASDVPDEVRQAIKMLAAFFYENREAYVVGQGLTGLKIPNSFDDLLWPDRVMTFR